MTDSRADQMRDLPLPQPATPTRATPLPHSDLAGRVADQLAQAARQLSGGPVDITLNPEELGRVRMHLSPGDAGLTLVVTAERSETLELMRRHIDTLAQEYRALGYASLEFAFGQQGHPQQEEDPQQGSAQPVGETGGQVAELIAIPAAAMPVTTTGLDIRI
ncbi:flagellar hook-length control protein FliK [Pseudooceanicola sp.]|uniref:flagellar hook-length control protein FliK n=1 Tax=Pseudooceanicola sp. TaxID=1914328 RepID=UPI0035C6B2ED